MLDLINNIDSGIILFVQDYIRNPILSAVLIPLTKSGDSGILLILIGLLLLIIKKTRQTGIVFLISLAVTFLLNDIILKNIFERSRPFLNITELQTLIRKPVSFSFPSGHTATTFACMVSLICMRVKYSGFTLIYAVLMGFSRIYAGVHYPTDVLVGAVVGIMAAIIVSIIYKKIKRIDVG